MIICPFQGIVTIQDLLETTSDQLASLKAPNTHKLIKAIEDYNLLLHWLEWESLLHVVPILESQGITCMERLMELDDIEVERVAVLIGDKNDRMKFKKSVYVLQRADQKSQHVDRTENATVPNVECESIVYMYM